MNKIAIVGAGGFGREVQMLIEDINGQKDTWQFIGYFDDGIESGLIVNSNSVLGGIVELNQWKEKLHVVIAIGNPVTKKYIRRRINNSNIAFASLIHPSVIIDKQTSNIDDGCIICAGNILTVNINIGKFVILNLACTVGHDTFIGDYCSVMPGVNLSGEVVLRNSVYVGTGAKIINQIEIGEETIVGAGAVVSKSLPPFCTAVGVPAKVVKINNG